jgi:hypothetical protein
LLLCYISMQLAVITLDLRRQPINSASSVGKQGEYVGKTHRPRGHKNKNLLLDKIVGPASMQAVYGCDNLPTEYSRTVGKPVFTLASD